MSDYPFTMSEEDIRRALQGMEIDDNLITEPAYRANKELWPDNLIPFTELHVGYLKAHPTIDPRQYLSNLKLKITRRLK